MENLVWTFASEAASVDELPSDNPLAGPLVISGTLSAEATVNGVDGIMYSVSLTLTPRQLGWQELSFKDDRHRALMKDGSQVTPPATVPCTPGGQRSNVEGHEAPGCCAASSSPPRPRVRAKPCDLG
jgi:hypothetical protein